MAKKVEGYIKLQIPAGKATPAPPVGPALGQHGVNIVATITKAQVEEIAKTKMPDLNAATIESAMSMVEGTCRSMGVTVTE